MISWSYKDKWYIINICSEKILINNLFEDECYAELNTRGVENYINGFLYKEKFLYVYNNNYLSSSYIIIMDLVHKNALKKFEIKSKIKDMSLWNNNYGAIFTDKFIYTLDMKKQIILNDLYGYQEEEICKSQGIKKIKLNDLGVECIITLEKESFILYQRN